MPCWHQVMVLVCNVFVTVIVCAMYICQIYKKNTQKKQVKEICNKSGNQPSLKLS